MPETLCIACGEPVSKASQHHGLCASCDVAYSRGKSWAESCDRLATRLCSLIEQGRLLSLNVGRLTSDEYLSPKAAKRVSAALEKLGIPGHVAKRAETARKGDEAENHTEARAWRKKSPHGGNQRATERLVTHCADDCPAAAPTIAEGDLACVGCEMRPEEADTNVQRCIRCGRDFPGGLLDELCPECQSWAASQDAVPVHDLPSGGTGAEVFRPLVRLKTPLGHRPGDPLVKRRAESPYVGSPSAQEDDGDVVDFEYPTTCAFCDRPAAFVLSDGKFLDGYCWDCAGREAGIVPVSPPAQPAPVAPQVSNCVDDWQDVPTGQNSDDGPGFSLSSTGMYYNAEARRLLGLSHGQRLTVQFSPSRRAIRLRMGEGGHTISRQHSSKNKNFDQYRTFCRGLSGLPTGYYRLRPELGAGGYYEASYIGEKPSKARRAQREAA